MSYIHAHSSQTCFSKHFLFVYFIMRCLRILYSDESKATAKKKKSVFFTLLLLAWKACSDFGFPCKKSKSKPGYYF